jgi:hypothetical protein
LSLDPYDYQQTSGIRLVANKLIIHNEWCTIWLIKTVTSFLTCRKEKIFSLLQDW